MRNLLATCSTKKEVIQIMATETKKVLIPKKLSVIYKDFAEYVAEMITRLQEAGKLRKSLTRGEKVKILANVTSMHDKICKAFKEKYPEGLMPLIHIQRFYQRVIFPKVFVTVGASPRKSYGAA